MTNRTMTLKHASQTTPAPEVRKGPSIVTDAEGATLVFCQNQHELQTWMDSNEVQIRLVGATTGHLARSHSLNTYEVIA